MAIERIEPEKCNGCGICVSGCPADVIRMDPQSHKAFVAYPEECSICRWCLRDCPTGAVVMTREKKIPFITSMG